VTSTSSIWRNVPVAIAVAAGLQTGVRAQPPAPPKSGSEVFNSACVSCHGPDGRGAPRSTVGFDVDIPDFTDCKFSSPEAGSDWHTVIEYGGPVRAFDRTMPAFKDALTSEEIDNVIAYLRGFCDDRRWPLGDLNLPRPLVTEKAFPENEGVLTTTYESAGGRSIGNSFVYERRIGARGQYELVVPFDLQKSQGGNWSRGLGDVAVAFKHVLFDNVGTGSILSAGGEVTFPTGKQSEGLGGGVTMLEPFAVFSQVWLTDRFLHVHAGLERSTNHTLADDETFVRTAVGRSFAQPNGGRIWSPMVEFLGVRELGAGHRVEWDTVPQVQVTLSRRQHIVFNIGAQLPINEREERSRKVLFYLLWDWFDGGLLEGW
jgi:mono/diheme cytochrome c family protein